MAFFPMFVDLDGAECLVVGGGKIALRKISVLLEFDAYVVVIAESICKEILILSEEYRDRITIYNRCFSENDCNGKALVIAATNDSQVNHEVAMICRSEKIPVNSVDCKQDCTFFFPSYVKQGNVVAAFSSGGNSPYLTQYLKEKEKDILTEKLGEMNEYLGKWRSYVIASYPSERHAYIIRKISDFVFESKKLPTDEEIFQLLENL